MVLDRIAAVFEKRWSLSDANLLDPTLKSFFGGGEAVGSGIVVNEKTAMTHSAVWRAVNFRSTVMGDIPVSLYEQAAGGGKTKLFTHPRHRLIHDLWNPEQSITASTAQHNTENLVLTWGNAYWWIERNGRSEPVALWPHPPSAVRVEVTKDGSILYLFRSIGQSDKTRAPRDVLHFKGPGPNPLIGWGRIRIARESIGQSLAAQQYGSRYFGQGARMGTIVTTLPGFRPEHKKMLLEDIAKQVTGPDNWHRPLVMSGVDKIVPVTVPAEDAQFIGTQEFGVAEAARWFDVPLVFMMLPNSEPKANAEQDSLNFVKFTVGPECRNFEQELNLKLLMPSERGKLFFEHNVDALLRGDFKSRMEGYHLGLMDGLFSRDDCLRRENMDPIGEDDGGDVRTVPVNSMNLKALIGQTAPPAAVTPPAKIGEPPAREVDWLAIYGPLFDDATERLLGKERKAIDGIVFKHGATDKMNVAVKEFYAAYDDSIKFVLVPILRSLAGTDDEAENLADWIAVRYCRFASRESWPQWSKDKAKVFMAGECRRAVANFKGMQNANAN